MVLIGGDWIFAFRKNSVVQVDWGNAKTKEPIRRFKRRVTTSNWMKVDSTILYNRLRCKGQRELLEEKHNENRLQRKWRKEKRKWREFYGLKENGVKRYKKRKKRKIPGSKKYASNPLSLWGLPKYLRKLLYQGGDRIHASSIFLVQQYQVFDNRLVKIQKNRNPNQKLTAWLHKGQYKFRYFHSYAILSALVKIPWISTTAPMRARGLQTFTHHLWLANPSNIWALPIVQMVMYKQCS